MLTQATINFFSENTRQMGGQAAHAGDLEPSHLTPDAQLRTTQVLAPAPPHSAAAAGPAAEKEEEEEEQHELRRV